VEALGGIKKSGRASFKEKGKSRRQGIHFCVLLTNLEKA